VTRPTRGSESGRAYLDLQNRARAERRGTQELLTLYVVERWLARLSASAHARKFVIKGGMLLAAYNARRPTADLDALARSTAKDEDAILSLVCDVARLRLADGVEYQTETATSRTIREQAVYAGVRIAMDSTIATATARFRLDVNFGDPITPAPEWVTIPTLRPGMEPIEVLGYPVVTILAEKIATALALGAANTRVRDYADIYTLTGSHVIAHRAARQALAATAAYRGIQVRPLSESLGNFADLRNQTFEAYRVRLGDVGAHLPADLRALVEAVTAFADPLTADAGEATWQPTERHWRLMPN
jgi:hypothetical protein